MLRLLNVVDEYTRVAVGFHIARSIGATEVRNTIERLIARHGAPKVIRSDNGKEFISTTVIARLAEHGIAAAPVAKGSPQQNCYIERFNGTMRRELLDAEVFHSVLDAQVVIGRFYEEYNTTRPHRSLGMLTPVAFDRAERARLATDEGSTEGGR